MLWLISALAVMAAFLLWRVFRNPGALHWFALVILLLAFAASLVVRGVDLGAFAVDLPAQFEGARPFWFETDPKAASLWILCNGAAFAAAALLGLVAGLGRRAATPGSGAPAALVLSCLVSANLAFAFAGPGIARAIGW